MSCVSPNIAARIEADEVAFECNVFFDLVFRYTALELLADEGTVAFLAFVLGAEIVAGIWTHASSLRANTGVRL
ncbi:hypothetical protein SBA2_80058 [Acidobacteriia bacterium SbA2]|nr:hypothetical protein SBA2_80058 [Acidobacteriia bacterium SbA2]